MAGYREAHASCPHCGFRLARSGLGSGCETCGGLWIEERVLDEMVRSMHDGFGALSLVERERDRTVRCPACQAALDNVVLEGIPVERCPQKHGVWFDADELQTALHAVASGEPPAGPDGADVPDYRAGFWHELLGWILGPSR